MGPKFRRLSRRAFLGGAGAMVALPWLEAMAPSRSALAATTLGPPTRLLFYYIPNGIHMAAWTPSIEGVGYDLPEILGPLEGLTDDILVLTGLDNLPGKPDGAGDHAGGTSAFLTCAHAKKTDGKDIYLGVSVDQVAAQAIGGETKFSSLQLGLEGGASVGGCDSGYSCAYSRNISWSGTSTPLPKTVNPQLVFDRLFGGFDPQASAAELERRRVLRLSVLDYVLGDAQKLQQQLGATDRHKVEEYLDGVRELELRLEQGTSELNCEPGVRPDANGLTIAEHSELMNDLMVKAFQCDQTRLISYMLGNAGSNRSYDFIGVSGAHHEISHHQDLQENFDKLTVIDTWEVAQFANLVSKLKATPEGDGTLLDHCAVFFSSEIEDGNAHRHENLPVLLAGRAGGAIDPGRHVVYSDGPPIANLYLRLLDAVGVSVTEFGDSTGPLDGLTT
ncbi:MAG: DUF1552 domain-containing protein [Myxococcota bacterium]|nr:DUF1552 domain-containing protein [Myxococcota bacterium]